MVMFDNGTVIKWVKKHDILLNRIAIINEIHGCKYDYSPANPCTVTYRLGCYTCTYAGDVLCAWDAYDLVSLDAAFARVDALSDALWLVRRAGYLRV